MTVGKDRKTGCNAVLINNFVITGLLLMSDDLPPGDAQSHCSKRCGCKIFAPKHVHKEEVEQINRMIFSRIKGEKEEIEEVNAEIIRGQNKIKNPKEKSRIENGDTIKTDNRTQVNITDSAGNKMSVGSGSAVRINEPTNFELFLGSIIAFIKGLKPKSKFEIRSPTAIISVRGTVFSVWTDKTTTSLTVIEGEVEFSDLKGNKVTVKSNQSCVCSKDQGLQQPVTGG